MSDPTEDQIREQCLLIRSQWSADEEQRRVVGSSQRGPIVTRGLSLSADVGKEMSNWLYLTDTELQGTPTTTPSSSENVQEVSTEEEVAERSFVPTKVQFGK